MRPLLRSPSRRSATVLARPGLIWLALSLTACTADTPTVTSIAPSLSRVATAERDDDTDGGQGLQRLKHVILIYLENHSFDNLYGEFPGADGLANGGSRSTQVDLAGVPFATLPMPSSPAFNVFPTNLANRPFSIETYVPVNANAPDLVHRFYQEQQQIDSGRMDKFAVISDAKGLVMGYYHTASLPLAREAAENTLCDNFFHAAFGGSFLNHIFLIAARPPLFSSAPASIRARIDPATGSLLADGAVTPDGYAVNTSFTVNTPHPANANAANLLPSQTMATIGDRLSEKGISWAWYSGGWNDALAGHADALFQYHHQPFAYFANYADGQAAKAAHLRDETEFIAAAKAGTLPAVSFVKPLGEVNEHPGYANVLSGELHVMELLGALRQSPHWKHTAVIITYDEHGGFWDHVPPPMVDRWGPGVRVPTLVVSPLARHGFVDHHRYDTTSILALIERRWGLAPLSGRDAAADPMEHAFDFNQGVGGWR
jgi:phospholipase C